MDRKIFAVTTVLSTLFLSVFLLFTDTHDNKIEAAPTLNVNPDILRDSVKKSQEGEDPLDPEDETGSLVIKVPKKGFTVQAQSSYGAPVYYDEPPVFFLMTEKRRS